MTSHLPCQETCANVDGERGWPRLNQESEGRRQGVCRHFLNPGCLFSSTVGLGTCLMDESNCGARVRSCTRAQTGNGRYVGLSDHLGTVVDEASGKNYASTSLRDGNESCERILTSTMQMIHGNSKRKTKKTRLAPVLIDVCAHQARRKLPHLGTALAEGTAARRDWCRYPFSAGFRRSNTRWTATVSNFLSTSTTYSWPVYYLTSSQLSRK